MRLLALAALLLASGSATLHAQPTAAVSTVELRALGRSVLDRQIAESGRDLNPRWRKDVATIIDSLRSAAAYRAHPLVWDITGDSSLNAAALPGGVMLVNVGLPLFCTELGAFKAPADDALARRIYIGCLAAVVGHEFGHLALGHSDSVATMIARRRDIADRRRQAGSIAAAVRDSVLMKGLQLERARELEADQAGALYLLRAGWQMQDAIDLLVAMDSVSRSDGSNRGELTWLNSHPRSAERAALLEGHRAKLKLNQRDFDDALALIEHDVMPDSALAMLDRVLADLPFIPAAQHARAVLLARRWLATASAADLQVRPALPAYDAQFMAAIKGGNASALRAAREAFTGALSTHAHPYTLANLAVLDAYAGDHATARQRAELAAQQLPDDADVQNNLGVVHFRAGRIAQARRAFERAERLMGDDVTPAVAFNVARSTLAAGDTAAARPLLARYVRFDNSTAWGREAAALARRINAGTAAEKAGKTTVMAGAPVTAADGSMPTGERAPVIAGIRLGATGAAVLSALGRPSQSEDARIGVVWRYPERGIELLVSPDAGAIVIVLRTREAGDAAGARVGDAVASALAVLGPAAERQGMGPMELLTFDRGNWTITLTARDGIVRQVGTALRSR